MRAKYQMAETKFEAKSCFDSFENVLTNSPSVFCRLFRMEGKKN